METKIKKKSGNNIETRLLNAIDNAKEEDIIRLIDEEHVDLNFEDENGATPLDHAIENDPEHFKIAKLLVQKGADINKTDDDGNTYLMKTAEFETDDKYGNFAKLLIEKGIDINKANDIGETPIMRAIVFNNKKIINLLLDNDVNLNLREKGEGYSVLTLPFIFGIGSKYILEFRNNLGEDYFYSEENMISLFKLLIKKGANINLFDLDGKTPLMMAIENGYITIAKFLFKKSLIIDRNFLINHRDGDNKTVYDYDIQYNTKLFSKEKLKVYQKHYDIQDPISYETIFDKDDIIIISSKPYDFNTIKEAVKINPKIPHTRQPITLNLLNEVYNIQHPLINAKIIKMKAGDYDVYYDYRGLQDYVYSYHHYPHLNNQYKKIKDIDKDGTIISDDDPIRKYKYSSLRSRKLTPTLRSSAKTIGKLRTI